MAQLKDLIVSGDARFAGKVFSDYPTIGVGTCTTAAGTAEKAITVDDSSWFPKKGNIILITFTNTNTASNPTFNINSYGAANVWYNTAAITTTNLDRAGYASRPMMYIYDGTNYVFIGWSN